MGLRLDYIWRHSAFKQSAELRNIRAARGIVDGSHEVRVQLYMSQRSRVAEKCAQALRNELWPAVGAHTTRRSSARARSPS